MKRVVLLLALYLFTAYAHAFGVPFAVDSLPKARALAAQDSSRHLLIFYTSET